jgi:hypothetical protein
MGLNGRFAGRGLQKSGLENKTPREGGVLEDIEAFIALYDE